MKISSAVLLAAAAATSIWRSERRHQEKMRVAQEQHQERVELDREQHRQRLELGTAELHQRLLHAIANDPEHQRIWALDGQTPEQCATMVRVNSQISLTQLRFSLGRITADDLQVQARQLMAREEVRRFWRATRDFRSRERQDDMVDLFVGILDHECAAVPETLAQSAAA